MITLNSYHHLSSHPLPLPIHHHCYFILPTKHLTTYHASSYPSSPVTRNYSYFIAAAAAKKQEGNKLASSSLEILDDHELLSRVSSAKDAAEALLIISEARGESEGMVSGSDCRLIISTALDRGNAELALSVFSAMRSSFDSSGWGENATSVGRWKWSRPDVNTYTLLVKGLAALLRVSDALKMIDCVCRVGVSPGEEVPFGKVVSCPSCMIAVAVAQPQQGIQACVNI